MAIAGCGCSRWRYCMGGWPAAGGGGPIWPVLGIQAAAGAGGTGRLADAGTASADGDRGAGCCAD